MLANILFFGVVENIYANVLVLKIPNGLQYPLNSYSLRVFAANQVRCSASSIGDNRSYTIWW